MSVIDTVISSRIRLARNVRGLSFPNCYNAYETEDIFNFLKASEKTFKNILDCDFFMLNSLSENSRLSLVERHLISPNLLKNRYGALVLSRDKSISIMINEEDHFRLQCIEDGFNLNKAYDKINICDDAIINSFNIAYDEKLGFLTSCPSNLGTGMRASVMMFLPALTMLDLLDEKTLNAIKKGGFTFRGAYGEGSKAEGNIYQLSNSYTLGLSEEQIINGVKSMVQNVCELEDKARQKLITQMSLKVKDRICRSWGIINNAYIMSSSELMSLLSDVKLGIILGILPDFDLKKLNSLAVLSGAATICQGKGDLSSEQRDIRRAAIVKSALKGD